MPNKYDRARAKLFAVLDILYKDFTTLQVLGFHHEYFGEREIRARTEPDDPTAPEYWREQGKELGRVMFFPTDPIVTDEWWRERAKRLSVGTKKHG